MAEKSLPILIHGDKVAKRAADKDRYLEGIGISILDADERRFSGFYLRLSAKICVLFNLNV